jgi:predicted O-methyltransferase YrrM
MSYLYNIKKPKDLKIIYKKDDISLNKKLYNNFNNNILKNIFKNKFISLLFNSDINYELIKILLNKYKFNDEDVLKIKSYNEKNNIMNDKKYNKIIYGNESLKFKYYCDIGKNKINNILLNLSQIFDILKVGGDIFIQFFNYCDSKTINIIYLLSFMFDKVVLYESSYLFCTGFLGNNSKVKKTDIQKLIDKDFTVEKTDSKELLEYIDNNIKETIDNYKLLLNKNVDKYIDNMIEKMVKELKQFGIKPKSDEETQVYKKIIEVFRRVMIDGKIVKIHSAIKSQEMNSIIDIIKKNNYKKCLEVGMAFGISAFSILSNKSCKLISIDPNQSTQWESNGVKLLKEFGFNKRHKLIEKPSYEGLPELLKKNKGTFDFIFIDGWHTFDYTLVDFFYSNLLLKVGGTIIIDDALHNGVSAFVKYLDTNYNFYKKIKSHETIVIYQKIKEDDRPWNYHVSF